MSFLQRRSSGSPPSLYPLASLLCDVPLAESSHQSVGMANNFSFLPQSILSFFLITELHLMSLPGKLQVLAPLNRKGWLMRYKMKSPGKLFKGAQPFCSFLISAPDISHGHDG